MKVGDAVSCGLTLGIALVFELVLFVATVAFGVVGVGLASAATVLALLDGATLGVDVVQFAICGRWLVRRRASIAGDTTYHCGCSRSLGGP
jgi:hypothetical protein